MISMKEELFAIKRWTDLYSNFYGNLTFIEHGDPAEKFGAESHDLDTKVPWLQEFWRCHVAPATNRPGDMRLSPQVNKAISLIAERSYEVYCNLLDAHDELASKDRLKPPRYRPCLNVLFLRRLRSKA